MKKKTIALLLAAAMTLAGCGGKAEAPASTGGDDAGTEAPAETGGDDAEAPAQSGAKDNADITIGFSSKDNSDTFVAAIADAAQARADELGVKLVMYDAGGDVNKQISDVETMIAQKVDAVIVIPQSVEGSAPVVGKCNDAGIPIIIDNGDIADTNFTAFVGCTDQESGEILGQWFVDNVEKGSKVCIIEGPMGQSGQVGRYAGFEAVGMLEHFEVLSTQTANWKRDEAMALVEDWITQYGEDLKAIICENDDMGLGALSACKAAGRSDIVVGGVDGLDDAVAAVKAGEYGISVLQDSQGQGAVGVDVALQIIKGEEYEKDTRIPFRAITAENVDAYLEGGVDAISE
ncbi:MAG: substrate-binding domain-containing protein [Lachnospiraceae bacterium]|jgi:inositol transport system substrate-binding protein|uniref:substrate-binding domain-containing protein n=1 Tax=Candidatus Merdisoma sp. JLR.KK011 TaxID=3114299 RepID=UPI001434DE87|nr:substrate-binding domain-containing protein [Lachnospiraceae bacterium]MCI9384572.1 substrate-binding domain-containing protein [Lachnospiraceae bacterium]MCI9479331.1 substrate-binding domain-containing protein [Lachnospiraceae bacterium]MCI9622392.1 substrate-binding domain-containing protein [Lachnospiraceae bacterium]GFI08680.1 D-threitol-binding protein [Lachnospiraceae bacterium]